MKKLNKITIAILLLAIILIQPVFALSPNTGLVAANEKEVYNLVNEIIDIFPEARTSLEIMLENQISNLSKSTTKTTDKTLTEIYQKALPNGDNYTLKIYSNNSAEYSGYTLGSSSTTHNMTYYTNTRAFWYNLCDFSYWGLSMYVNHYTDLALNTNTITYSTADLNNSGIWMIGIYSTYTSSIASCFGTAVSFDFASGEYIPNFDVQLDFNVVGGYSVNPQYLL